MQIRTRSQRVDCFNKETSDDELAIIEGVPEICGTHDIESMVRQALPPRIVADSLLRTVPAAAIDSIHAHSDGSGSMTICKNQIRLRSPVLSAHYSDP